jgi:hypothetical protein
MSRPRTVAIFMGAATVAVAASAVVRHVRGASNGRAVRGGIVIGDAAVYDAASRLVLGPFLRRIAADIVVPRRTARGCSRSGADPATSRSCWPAGMAWM